MLIAASFLHHRINVKKLAPRAYRAEKLER
jgi:hypothetical protein